MPPPGEAVMEEEIPDDLESKLTSSRKGLKKGSTEASGIFKDSAID